MISGTVIGEPKPDVLWLPDCWVELGNESDGADSRELSAVVNVAVVAERPRLVALDDDD